jgi:hypothetical protein
MTHRLCHCSIIKLFFPLFFSSSCSSHFFQCGSPLLLSCHSFIVLTWGVSINKKAPPPHTQDQVLEFSTRILYQSQFWWCSYSVCIAHSPLTLSNLSPFNIASIFRYPRTPRNPVCASRLDPSVSAFSHSLHRHPYICFLLNSCFTSVIIKKIMRIFMMSWVSDYRRGTHTSSSAFYLHSENRLVALHSALI